jgi:hypothetical protein
MFEAVSADQGLSDLGLWEGSFCFHLGGLAILGPVSFTLLHGQNDRDGSRKAEKLHYSSSAKGAIVCSDII